MLRTLQPQRLLRSSALQHYARRNEPARVRNADQLRRWKSTSNGSGKVSNLTRKERRRLEREAKKNKNAAVPAKEMPTSSSWSFDNDSIRTRLSQWIPNPGVPGGARGLFHKTHRMQLGTRFSLALVLFYLIESEETSPIAMDMSQGPSMLPSFATMGDIYLRATGAWSRLLSIPINYQRGDLIVFRDDTGRHAGKRIIGVEGDEVLRYGEYAHRYLNRPDWGIAKSQRVHGFENDEQHVERDAKRRIIVPPNHVWLEGDFPPFSVDSRHYGPIPVDWIRGRILLRVWPWKGGSVSRSRPEPLLVEVALSGKYNLHSHPVARNQEDERD